MRSNGVVVPAPALDHDLRLLGRIEDLAVEQFVPELTCVTPIERIASATGRPCAASTSTCRSLATISSGLCLFRDIDPSSFGSREPYLREDHSSGGRPADAFPTFACSNYTLPSTLTTRNREMRWVV